MDNLSGVKVGDVLATDSYGRDVRLMPVIAVGKLHVTTAGGSKWAIKNGRLAGEHSGWSGKYAWIATDKDRMNAQIKQAKQKLERFDVTAENLELVLAFLADAKVREDV